MKRIVLSAILILCILLVSCGGQTASETKESSDTNPPQTDLIFVDYFPELQEKNQYHCSSYDEYLELMSSEEASKLPEFFFEYETISRLGEFKNLTLGRYDGDKYTYYSYQLRFKAIKVEFFAELSSKWYDYAKDLPDAMLTYPDSLIFCDGDTELKKIVDGIIFIYNEQCLKLVMWENEGVYFTIRLESFPTVDKDNIYGKITNPKTARAAINYYFIEQIK